MIEGRKATELNWVTKLVKLAELPKKYFSGRSVFLYPDIQGNYNTWNSQGERDK